MIKLIRSFSYDKKCKLFGVKHTNKNSENFNICSQYCVKEIMNIVNIHKSNVVFLLESGLLEWCVMELDINPHDYTKFVYDMNDKELYGSFARILLYINEISRILLSINPYSNNFIYKFFSNYLNKISYKRSWYMDSCIKYAIKQHPNSFIICITGMVHTDDIFHIRDCNYQMPNKMTKLNNLSKFDKYIYMIDHLPDKYQILMIGVMVLLEYKLINKLMNLCNL